MARIIYQDKNLAVFDKPAGILVHPTEANEKNTLVDFIINEWPEIKKFDWPDPTRPGIVHRLDQNTSGLIIIAKNPQTLAFLQEQFKKHLIEKTYLALVLGRVEPKNGEIITQISRAKGATVKQKISSFSFSWDKNSKQAISNYQVIQEYTNTLHHMPYTLSFLAVEIKTGRTHQIRVQLKAKGWPIVGDQLYNIKASNKISEQLGLARQFLHAHKLKLTLPDGTTQEFISPLPSELQTIINNLKKN